MPNATSSIVGAGRAKHDKLEVVIFELLNTFTAEETMPAPQPDVLESISEVARAKRALLAGLARAEGLTAEDAVDCVQEGLCTLLDLVQSGEIALGPDPSATLATIVRNAARNQRRRHFRSRPHEDFGSREREDEGLALPEELLARA